MLSLLVSSMVLAYVNSHFANTKHDTSAQQRAISGTKTGISELPVNSEHFHHLRTTTLTLKVNGTPQNQEVHK